MMKPDRLKLRDILDGSISPVLFERVIAQIKQGSLFVYPTETIYGIGGIATNDVKEKIYGAKRREPENPLILIGGCLSLFSNYNIVFNKNAEILAEAFWPGRLTLILPVADSKEKMSIRVSDHPFLQMMTEYVELPLYSTSANISGTEYVNDPDIIYDIFSDKIDMMIDDGVLPESSPSTVVDVSNNEDVIIVREGTISSDNIKEVVNK